MGVCMSNKKIAHIITFFILGFIVLLIGRCAFNDIKSIIYWRNNAKPIEATITYVAIKKDGGYKKSCRIDVKTDAGNYSFFESTQQSTPSMVWLEKCMLQKPGNKVFVYGLLQNGSEFYSDVKWEGDSGTRIP